MDQCAQDALQYRMAVHFAERNLSEMTWPIKPTIGTLLLSASIRRDVKLLCLQFSTTNIIRNVRLIKLPISVQMRRQSIHHAFPGNRGLTLLQSMSYVRNLIRSIIDFILSRGPITYEETQIEFENSFANFGKFSKIIEVMRRAKIIYYINDRIAVNEVMANLYLDETSMPANSLDKALDLLLPHM